MVAVVQHHAIHTSDDVLSVVALFGLALDMAFLGLVNSSRLSAVELKNCCNRMSHNSLVQIKFCFFA